MFFEWFGSFFFFRASGRVVVSRKKTTRASRAFSIFLHEPSWTLIYDYDEGEEGRKTKHI